MQNKKQKIKIRNRFNYQQDPPEKNTKPSLAVQGESYTIRELFERHAQGMLPPASPELYDPEGTDFEDAERLIENPDISDAHNLAEEILIKNKASKPAQAKAEAKKVEKEKIQESDDDSHGDEGTNKKSNSDDDS